MAFLSGSPAIDISTSETLFSPRARVSLDQALLGNILSNFKLYDKPCSRDFLKGKECGCCKSSISHHCTFENLKSKS